MKELELVRREVDRLIETASNALADDHDLLNYINFYLSCIKQYTRAVQDMHADQQKDVAELSRILRHWMQNADGLYVNVSDMIEFLDELDGV